MTETDTGRLLELADRCEQATGPDAPLDRDIALATHRPHNGCAVEPEERSFLIGGMPLVGCERDSAGRINANILAHPFTASLDAAMSLVPERAIWEVGHKVHYPRPPQAPDRANYAFVNVGVPGAVKSFGGKSLATPALALCAAACRAGAASATWEG